MRVRILYIAAVIIVIVLGIYSRKFADSLPVFVSNHAGDALWASMIYLGVRAIAVNHRRSWAAEIVVRSSALRSSSASFTKRIGSTASGTPCSGR